jgi:cytochrome c oxidase subunit 2
MVVLMIRTATLALVSVAVLGAVVRGDSAAGQDPKIPIVRVSVERFAFTPSEIRLQVGDEVELRFTSQDTVHGFRLVGTDTEIAIPKRGAGEASLVYKAAQAGRFVFECSRMCGAGHHFMRGEIVVRPRGAAEAR